VTSNAAGRGGRAQLKGHSGTKEGNSSGGSSNGRENRIRRREGEGFVKLEGSASIKESLSGGDK